MNELMTNVSEKLTKKGSMALLKLSKHSPTILAVVGAGGFVATVVLACTKTYKHAPTIMDEHKEMMDTIQQAQDANVPEYSEQDAQKDKVLTYIQTAKSFGRVYWPVAALGTASLGCLLGSQHILTKRNAALAAAYKLAQDAFSGYRKRVVDELGEDQDFHFANDTVYEKMKTQTVDENGKAHTKSVKVQALRDGFAPSMYARLYGEQEYDIESGTYEGSSQWVPQFEYNLSNLVIKNNWANEHLKARGYLFLNDVYDELGFPRTKAGQIVGWVWDGDGDNYVSFGPEFEALIDKRQSHIPYKQSNVILLDFNVDGEILDLI